MLKILVKIGNRYISELLIAAHSIVKSPDETNLISDIMIFFSSADPDKDLAEKIQLKFQQKLKQR